MSVASLLSWIVCGLLVGLIARALLQRRQNLNLLMTLALGVAGAVVGGFLFSLAREPSGEPFSLSGNAWQGWLVAILGAVIVLWGYVSMYPRRWWQ